MSDDKPWPRPGYTRQYEFPEEPDPVVRVELDHLLRRLSRATGAEREAIDLEIDKLVAQERARQLEVLRPRPVELTDSAPTSPDDDGDTDADGDTPQGAARQRGPDPDAMVTAEAVRAERDRCIKAGEPSGYKALARHFGVSVSTIRRRLDKL